MNTKDKDDVENRKQMKQMLFIYQSIQNGWIVRKLENGEFEFKRPLIPYLNRQ